MCGQSALFVGSDDQVEPVRQYGFYGSGAVAEALSALWGERKPEHNGHVTVVG